ncbi:MAG TPA: hypothetical protein VFV88_04645 [Steroidobacteraceae bacterium]|jgi:hypothetical protein|nr:hypothetical protein [Steroidobacteraceae bacterium]
MGSLFSAYILAMLLGIVFLPLFVIAFAMVRSVGRAFILASTFTLGAMGGFFLGVLGGSWLLEVHPDETGSVVMLLTFAGAAAVAGGVIALWLLGRMSGSPPWRRDGSP